MDKKEHSFQVQKDEAVEVSDQQKQSIVFMSNHLKIPRNNNEKARCSRGNGEVEIQIWNHTVLCRCLAKGQQLSLPTNQYPMIIFQITPLARPLTRPPNRTLYFIFYFFIENLFVICYLYTKR